MMRLGTVLFLVLASVALVGCGGSADLSAMRLFEEAQGAFDKGEFGRAATLYESLLEKSGESGAVLYNLGNAYSKAGRFGHAIAAYRRAMRYRPRDPLLEANFKTARTAGAPGAEPRSLLDHVFFFRRWLSYPEKATLLAAFATLTFVLALLSVILVRRRALLRTPAWAALGLTMLLGIVLALDWYAIEVERHGVVVAKEVTARKGNAESYAPAFTEPLTEGTEFTVLEARRDWLHVELPGRLSGWLPRDQVVLY
jgi:tetratricopeptide (TPR) repeat protein